MLLFHVKTIIRESCNFELACLKKEKMTLRFGYSATFWFGTFRTSIVLLVKKTVEDEWYVVIKVHTLSIIEVFFCVIIYCVSMLSLHIQSTGVIVSTENEDAIMLLLAHRFFHALDLASYPGLLTPAFVACGTNVGEGPVKLNMCNDVP